MKTLLNLISISAISIYSSLNVDGAFEKNNINNKLESINRNNLVISKTPDLEIDVATIASFDNLVLVSSRSHYPYSTEGVYRSINDTNFVQIAEQNKMNSIISTSDGTLYVADGGYLKKSLDGINFTPVFKFMETVTSIAITREGVIYVGDRNFLYQSTDGTTFNKIHDFGDYIIEKIAIAENKTMYLQIGNARSELATKSSDLGYHFNIIPNIEFVNDISVLANNEVYIVASSLFKSIDNGNTFIAIPNSRQLSPDNIFNDNANGLYILTLHGLYKLNPDDTFQNIWTFSEVVTTGAYAANGIIWVGTYQGLFKLSFT